ncbi:MAG: isochorismatase family cysteine hydrolase [Anaerolineae bacterium]|jgi:nicotinamidase-related amidase
MRTVFEPGDKVEFPQIEYQEAAHLPADKTAVVVVDMQNDFVKHEGSLTVPAAMETVPNIQALLKSARSHGVHIAYTQDTHVQGDEEWDYWPEHVQMGSWGWEIIDELKPQADDLIAQKNRYDAFYGSWLDHYLSHVWRVENLVIVGTVANICVLHTAASAGLRYFRLVIPADGISALTEFDQALTLRQTAWLYPGGVVRSVEDVHFQDE